MTWHLAQLLVCAYAISWVLGRLKLTFGFRTWLASPRVYINPVVHATSESPPRPPAAWLLALLECSACTGFHLGWIYGAAMGQVLVACILTGFTVLTSNLLLEAIVSNIKE